MRELTVLSKPLAGFKGPTCSEGERSGAKGRGGEVFPALVSPSRMYGTRIVSD